MPCDVLDDRENALRSVVVYFESLPEGGFGERALSQSQHVG